uniref:Uncharacterized protein n=1 Tax=Arundo donax TaxID=35708 RepID=A0A0A9FX86_ARUDO
MHMCYYGIALILTEDGGLRFVGLNDGSLDLWSLERMGADGVVGWTHLMELDTQLSIDDSSCSTYLIGSTKGPDSDVVFVSTNVGIFMIELESQKVRKVCERGCGRYPIFPYMGFFTPSIVSCLPSLMSHVW